MGCSCHSVNFADLLLSSEFANWSRCIKPNHLINDSDCSFILQTRKASSTKKYIYFAGKPDIVGVIAFTSQPSSLLVLVAELFVDHTAILPSVVESAIAHNLSPVGLITSIFGECPVLSVSLTILLPFNT